MKNDLFVQWKFMFTLLIQLDKTSWLLRIQVGNAQEVMRRPWQRKNHSGEAISPVDPKTQLNACGAFLMTQTFSHLAPDRQFNFTSLHLPAVAGLQEPEAKKINHLSFDPILRPWGGFRLSTVACFSSSFFGKIIV